MRWKYEEQVSRLRNHAVTFFPRHASAKAPTPEVKSSKRHSATRNSVHASTRTVNVRPMSDISSKISSSPALFRPTMVASSDEDSSRVSSKNVPKIPTLLKFDSLASLMSYLKRLASRSESPLKASNLKRKPKLWSPLTEVSPTAPPSSSSSSSSVSSVSDPNHASSSESPSRSFSLDTSLMDDVKHTSSSSSFHNWRVLPKLGRGRRSLHKHQHFPPHTGEYVEDMVRRYVELLIVADRAMYEYYGDDVEHYVLTLIAVVASIYHDPTIGQPIDIVLVKLMVLKDNDKFGNLSISSNAIQTLKSFCAWQHRINTPESGPAGHHDTAVLLTRPVNVVINQQGMLEFTNKIRFGTNLIRCAKCLIRPSRIKHPYIPRSLCTQMERCKALVLPPVVLLVYREKTYAGVRQNVTRWPNSDVLSPILMLIASVMYGREEKSSHHQQQRQEKEELRKLMIRKDLM
ncbi:hypothetical protein LSH36_660g05004 [Paralvinella palmiformis]|uniref:Peptidase M12B domain-containing protein n=1 Tax=Paralvinella palmiformis TaxID=53620 RepID=A0AAD9J4L1_9ANNE|nr:hypothetical protein LSH36_660g05004 [Paralvinella palmiformis]